MKRAAVILLSAFISSCVSSHKEYPKNWPPLDTTFKGNCPNIGGKYRVISEPMYEDTPCHHIGRGFYCRSLLEELVDEKTELENQEWIEITMISGGEIKVTHVKSSNARNSFTLGMEGKKFSCEEDGLVVSLSGEFRAEDGAIGVNTGIRKTFLKTIDGSLVMKEKTSGGGLVFVVPMAGSSTRWWQWQSAEQ